jgi:CHAT domain-containing protein/tetratricopeptide (TPR) repeat protein
MKFLFLLSLLITISLLQAQESLDEKTITELNQLFATAREAEQSDRFFLIASKAFEKANKYPTLQDSIRARILFNLAHAYDYDLEDIEQSIFYYKQALTLQKKINLRSKIYVDGLFSLGNIYDELLNDIQQAEPLYLEAIEIHKIIVGENHPDYAESLRTLAWFYCNAGIYQKAEKYLLQALEIKHPDYTITLNYLVFVYLEIGNIDQAERYCHKAIQKRDDQENSSLAVALDNMGQIYKLTGRFEEAELYYTKALQLYLDLNGKIHEDYSASLTSLGALYYTIGSYKKSASFFMEAIKVDERLYGKKDPSYANALNDLAALYDKIGEHKKAAPLFEEALDILAANTGKGNMSYAVTLNNLGNVYLNTKEYDKAALLFIEALDIFQALLGKEHPNYAYILENLATLYYRSNNTKEMEPLCQEALAIYEKTLGKAHPYYARSLYNLSNVAEQQKDYKQAWDYCFQGLYHLTGLQMDQNINDSWVSKLEKVTYPSNKHRYVANLILKRIYSLLALESTNQFKEKQVLVAQLAINLLKQTRDNYSGEADKLRMLTESNDWLLKSFSALDFDKDIITAFRLAEQNKSVLLKQVLQKTQAHQLGNLPDSLIKKEKAFQKKYANLEAQLIQKRPTVEKDSLRSIFNQLNIEIKSFENSIKTTFPKYAKFQYEEVRSSLTEIQSTLAENQAFIEYVLGDSILYIFYINQNEALIEQIPIDKKGFGYRIESLHNALSNYPLLIKEPFLSYNEYTKHAHWFYKNLLHPILSKSTNNQGINHLIIVTDGALGHLPFETFLVEPIPIIPKEQGQPTYDQLPYLVNTYKVSYNYSASLWKDNKANSSKNNNGQVLGIAANYVVEVDSTKKVVRLPNHKNLRGRLNPLSAARQEVTVLSEKYAGLFCFDNNASERIFKEKASDYGVIHLAMHGLLNKKTPLLSSLVFTENNDSLENNFLQAYEISKLELNADLIVLSACETGYGKFEKGNGIASLARSFMYAGAASMIVSLWQVSDHPTAYIMQNLYENLANGMDKSAALQKAKLTYIQDVEGSLAHPAFWSPFIQIGNNAPITIQKKESPFYWLILGLLILVAITLGFIKSKIKFR